MAKRKKKSNQTFRAFIILCFALILVWAMVFYSNLMTTKDLKDQDQNVVSKTDTEQPTSTIEQAVQDPEAEDQDDVAVVPPEAPPEAPPEIVTQTPQVEEEPQGGSEEDTFDSNIELESLSNEGISWSWKRNSEHLSVTPFVQGIDLEKYGTYFNVNTEEKVIYLTFDEGYENGYTSQILDILLENDVQATFFVTQSYIENNIALCKQMKEQGHMVGNHSATHRDFPELTNKEIENELMDTAQTFLELTAYNLDMFFRPPGGKFSERVLYLTRSMGYRTIFWSLGYNDWDAKNQPGREVAYNHMMENYHPGAIFLLHAVSQSTTEALEDAIKALKAEGYRFGNLYEVE